MVKTKSAKGKSKKITWKKIRHPDVDDFLEEQRREERLGISEKSNEDLFFLDQLGFDDDYNDLSKKKKEAENKRKLRNSEGPLVTLEDLRCFQILKPDSQVKDPVIKRNPVKKGGGFGKTLDMKLKDELRYFRQSLDKKPGSKKNSEINPGGIKDLWEDDLNAADRKQNNILSNEWLHDNTKRNLLRNRTTYNPNRKTNEIKPIEAPHPGLSYNPSYQDHQDILIQTVEAEKEKIRVEKKIQRAIAVPRNIPDLPEIEVKSEPESDDDEKDGKSKLKLSKPKTRQQKRKEKEEKEKQMKSQQKKQQAVKESEVFRVKTLKKQITARDAKTKLRLKKRVEKKLHRDKFGVKVLSKVKFEDVQTKPLLRDEMPRGLINSGGSNTGADLLLDRFKSLQKRNVIEPTLRQKQKRKHKLKKYIRDNDKMEWEKTGMWNGEKLMVRSGRKRPQRPRQQTIFE